MRNRRNHRRLLEPAESKTLLESGTKIETLLENWRMNRQNRRILLEIRDQTDE